jgi:hypothetical protein
MFAAHRRPQFLLVQRTSKVVLFAIMAGFIQLVYAVAPILMPTANAQTTTFGFGNGTPQTFVVPQGVTSIGITIIGGGGGWGGTDNYNGGKPSYAGKISGTITGLTAGQKIMIAVGGGGNNGDGCVGTANNIYLSGASGGQFDHGWGGSGVGGISGFNGLTYSKTGIFNGGTGGPAGNSGCSGAGGGGGAATVVVVSGGQEIVAGGGGGGGGGNSQGLYNQETGTPNVNATSTTSVVAGQSYGASVPLLSGDGGGGGGGGGGWNGGTGGTTLNKNGTSEWTGYGGNAGSNRIPSGYSNLSSNYVSTSVGLNYSVCHSQQARSYATISSQYGSSTTGGNPVPGVASTYNNNAGCGADGSVVITYMPSVSIYQTDSTTVFESATPSATSANISGTYGTSSNITPNGAYQSVTTTGLAKGNYLGYATDALGTSNPSSNSVTIGTACGSQTFSGIGAANISVNNSNYGGGNPGYCNLQILGGTGSWTVPAGVNTIHVAVVGGGGGGAENVGGGGSGGQVVDSTTYVVTPGSSISLSIGAGGAGGATPGNNATWGSSGSSSTFGILTAVGGNPGTSSNATPGASVNTGANAGAGAGGAGTTYINGAATAGTNGVTLNLAGSSVTVGGGGGGGTWFDASTPSLKGGAGGAGGGGAGGSQVESSTAYTPCPLGSTQYCPADSALQIKTVTGTNVNGLYWINVNGVSTQVYCIMDSAVDGGGWMLAMKGASNGSNFPYSSTYWTDTTTTLNTGSPGPLQVNSGAPTFASDGNGGTAATANSIDAKYNVFNFTPSNQFLTLFPDIVEGSSVGGKFPTSTFKYGYAWEEYDTGTTPFGGTYALQSYTQPWANGSTVNLQTYNSTTNSVTVAGNGCVNQPTPLAGIFLQSTACLIRQVKPSYDSAEPNYSVVGSGVFSAEPYINFFGFNHQGGGGGYQTRLGIAFNENNSSPYYTYDDNSDDVVGGIGLSGAGYQAGDHTNCCATLSGQNKQFGYELYVRNTYTSTGWVTNLPGAFGVNGVANTGGGGGGGASYSGFGGNGGSGIVYLSYIIPPTHTAPVTDTTTAGLTYTFTDIGTAATGLTRGYTWQKSTDTGTTWTTVQASSSNAYTTPVLDTSTSGSRYQYRVIVVDTDTNNDRSTDTSTAFWLNINPKIALTQNQYPVSTYGTASVDSYTATYGTSTKTFTYTAPASNKITFDSTTNTVSSVLNMRIDSATPVGTYYETITATDSVSATTSETITLTVNKAPAFLVTETHTVGTYYYTGQPLVDTPTVYTTGMVNGETVTATGDTWTGTSFAGVAYLSTSPPVNAGQYRATPLNINLGAFANNYLGDTPTAGDTVTINRRVRTVTVSALSTTLKYGDTTTLSIIDTATGVTDTPTTIQNDGLVQFIVDTPTACSMLDSTTIQIISNAACSVHALQFRGANYETATSASLSLTIMPAFGLLDTPTSNTITFGTSFTETATTTGLVYGDTVSSQSFYYQAPFLTGSTCATGGTCHVGDTGPGGGIIVYAAPSVYTWGQYIEMAPQGWANGLPVNTAKGEVAGTSVTDPKVQWCNPVPYTDPTNLSQNIGYGYANTQLMLNNGCNGGAAVIASSYNGGGKSDWFLPDQTTLSTIGAESTTVNALLGIPATNALYWSSHNYTTTTANYEDLNTTNALSSDMAVARYVRPVRAFVAGPYSNSTPIGAGTYNVAAINLTLGNSRPISNYALVRYQPATLTIARAPRTGMSIGNVVQDTLTGIINETNTLSVHNATPHTSPYDAYVAANDTVVATYSLVSSSGASDRVCSVTAAGKVYATGSSSVTCVVTVVVAQSADYLSGQDTVSVVFNTLSSIYGLQNYGGAHTLQLVNGATPLVIIQPSTASDSSSTTTAPSISGFTVTGNDATTGETITVTGSGFWSPVSNDVTYFFGYQSNIVSSSALTVNVSANPQTMTIRLPANWFANLGVTPGTNVGPIIIQTPSGTALSLADFFTQ